MQKNHLLRKGLAAGIILLFLGISIPSISASSNEDITIYISAGIFRERYGTFGLGYVVRVYNNGDDNITGVCYVNRTTRFGEIIRCEAISFMISNLISFGTVGVTIFDGHPINLISLTVKVEDRIVTKSGYEIGPFVLIKK
ncbi:MAG: hypothetical protein V1726_08075 [Methanobacteriota archaeon]